MKGPQFAKARDANEPEIVDAIKRFGFSVERLDSPVDLLVGKRHRTWLIEVKDGSKPPSARPLTPAQRRFFKSWRGSPLWVVRSITEAACVLGAEICPGRRARFNEPCGCGENDDPPWFVAERAKMDKRKGKR